MHQGPFVKRVSTHSEKGDTMTDQKTVQRDDARRATENAADQAKQATRDAADQNRAAIRTAADATEETLDKAKAGLDVQAEQAVVLAKEFIETQTDVMEVTMLSIGNAKDVGENSSRLLASYGSAWIDMTQRLMQFNIDNLRRLRESRGFTRSLEAQANLVKETLSQWANTQSRMAEQARESASQAGRQFQQAR